MSTEQHVSTPGGTGGSIMSRVLGAVTVVLGAAGTVLWLGASMSRDETHYFWGLWLIAAAIVLHLVQVYLVKGRAELIVVVRKSVRKMIVPIMGIIAAIVIGGVLMLVTGYDPVAAYQALFFGGLVRNWHISVLNASPLIFTALSVAFAFKAGLFNIGAEGQYYLGAMAATWLSLRLALPGVVSLPLIFVFTGLFGAAWAIVPAYLKVRTGAHEVITTMMLAHTARYLSPVFIRANGGDPATSTHPYVTDEILESTFLPRFQLFLPDANYRVHTGILVAVVVALGIHYLLYHTSIGFEIRAVGENKDAARAQGISVGKNIFRALLLAGFLAGLAGFNQVNGLDHRLFENLQAGYGWNGISVALLAGGNPIGVVFTGLLWGALDAGGQFMSRTTQTPSAIVEIVKGTILFLVVARYIYTAIGNRRRKRRQKRNAEADIAAVESEGA
ncbi:MAG: ABC transporter permease [Alkalispirochaeta sp.]